MADLTVAANVDSIMAAADYAAIKTLLGVSGLDVTLVTGTAGTNGFVSTWNADGDLVDGKALPTGAIVGTTDTQALTNKTLTDPGIVGDVIFTERADHSSTPGAGFGYLWVKSDTPSSLVFTDDAGTDFLLIGDADIGSTVQAYDADILKADTSDQLTVGFSATDYAAGTKSSGTYTPDPADGNFQVATNGGAHTLAPPSLTCNVVIHYTNNGSAGAITTSGFTLVDGDAFDTTDTNEFIAYITKVNDVSHLAVKALQ